MTALDATLLALAATASLWLLNDFLIFLTERSDR